MCVARGDINRRWVSKWKKVPGCTRTHPRTPFPPPTHTHSHTSLPQRRKCLFTFYSTLKGCMTSFLLDFVVAHFVVYSTLKECMTSFLFDFVVAHFVVYSTLKE